METESDLDYSCHTTSSDGKDEQATWTKHTCWFIQFEHETRTLELYLSFTQPN